MTFAPVSAMKNEMALFTESSTLKSLRIWFLVPTSFAFGGGGYSEQTDIVECILLMVLMFHHFDSFFYIHIC